MNLIRLITIKLEQLNGPVVASAIEIGGFESEEIVYHVALMLDSNLIDVYENNHSATDYVITRLTNSGHDFVEFYKDEKIWEKALSDIGTKAGVVTFSMLVTYIRIHMEEKLENSLE